MVEAKKEFINDNILMSNKGAVKVEDIPYFKGSQPRQYKSEQFIPLFSNSLPKAVKIKKHPGKAKKFKNKRWRSSVRQVNCFRNKLESCSPVGTPNLSNFSAKRKSTCPSSAATVQKRREQYKNNVVMSLKPRNIPKIILKKDSSEDLVDFKSDQFIQRDITMKDVQPNKQ